MGMLFARRRKDKVVGLTTTNNLLSKERKNVDNVQPQRAKNIPTNGQPKFKV